MNNNAPYFGPRAPRETKLHVLNPSEARVPPHSLEAEASLLGCILLDPLGILPRCVSAHLTAKSFYDNKNGTIYEAILALHANQRSIGQDTVAEHLRDTRKLDEIGGFGKIIEVTRQVPTTAEAPYFLEQVRKLWILRQVMHRSVRIIEDCHAYAGEPLVDLLAPHAAWFTQATTRVRLGDRGTVETLHEVLDGIRADTRARVAGQEDRRGWIYTGFPEFDDIDSASCLGPFGQVDEDHGVLVGGGSSSGKSALMRQWAGEALRRNQRVLVYTLETSTRGFIQNLAAAWAGVNLRLAQNWTPDMLVRFEAAIVEINALAEKRLFVFQTSDNAALRTIEGIADHLRAWTAQNGAADLVLLDYMQIVGTTKRCNTREQEVANVAHTWQWLQREIGCVTLAGAQLNEASLASLRQRKTDKDGKVIHEVPNRGALRESQALYHDADVVIFLHKPVDDRTGRDQTQPDISRPEMWLCVDKRRNGPLGKACTWFNKQFGRFESISEQGRQAALSTRSASGAQVPRAPWMRKDSATDQPF